MLWVPQKGIKRQQHNTGALGATNIGTAVTTGASLSTKGSPSEIIAATDFDAYRIMVMVSALGENAVASDCALDILTGSATEDVLIPNLLCGQAPGGSGTNVPIPRIWTFPLYIPAGTRIAAQAASRRLSFNFYVAIWLFGGDGAPAFRVGSKVTTYGISSVPNGTTVVAGQTAVEGSWTQIASATTEDHFAIIPSFQPTNDTASFQRLLQMDVGLGAATEEEIANYWFTTTSAETTTGPFPPECTLQDIPAGTRLSARLSNNSTNDAYDVAFHCVS